MRVILITRDLGRIVIWRQSISCLQFVTEDTGASASFATVAPMTIFGGWKSNIEHWENDNFFCLAKFFVQTSGLFIYVLLWPSLYDDKLFFLKDRRWLRCWRLFCRCHLKLNYNDVGGGGLGWSPSLLCHQHWTPVIRATSSHLQPPPATSSHLQPGQVMINVPSRVWRPRWVRILRSLQPLIIESPTSYN